METGELRAAGDTILHKFIWEYSGFAAVMLDAQGIIRQHSAGFKRLLPPGDAPEGKAFADYVDGFSLSAGLDAKTVLVMRGGQKLSAWTSRLGDGYIVLSEKISPTAAELASLRAELDVQEVELGLLRQQLSRILDTDPTTGLSNRKYFMEMLTKSISFANRSGLPMALIMGDMDNFKFITETYGHDVRDKILALFGDVIRQTTRVEDVAARFGGDEFALILPNTTKDDARICAERLWEAVKTIRVDKVTAKISASFGVTDYHPEESEDELLQRLESSMFKAKASVPVSVAVI